MWGDWGLKLVKEAGARIKYAEVVVGLGKSKNS